MAPPTNKPDLYVVTLILEALHRKGGPVRRTPLQTASNVNYTIFARYLDYLAERGLVALETEADGGARVVLTPKGADAYRFLFEGISRIIGPLDRKQPQR